jgi:hypothetical protein
MLQLHATAVAGVTICFKSMLLLLHGPTCHRGSPCRLVLHACGRVTTLGATARSSWVTVCFKSMLLLHGSPCSLLVLLACTPAGGDTVVCACGRMKAKRAWVVPAHVCAWVSQSFFPLTRDG